MAPEDEMLEFTRSLFRGRPDLSTLTHSIVRQKFLKHAGRDHLEPEEKQALKRLVEEELLKMQVDAGAREEKLDLARAKRPPSPCSDPQKKRFRFNSESESSSGASSPDRLGLPEKNRTAEEEKEEEEEEQEKASPRRIVKKAVESTDEEQQMDPVARTGLEESEEERDAPVRTSKVYEEENNGEDEEKKKLRGGARKKAGTKNKQASGKASASKKQVREDSESSEEPVQRRAKKVWGKTGARSCQESEESEEEETVAKLKENKEEEAARARGNRGVRAAPEERSCKKSKAGRLMEDLRDSGEEKAVISSGSNSEGDEVSPVQRKRPDGTRPKSGKGQSGSSEDGECSSKVQATAQGAPKKEEVESINGKSDTEGQVSDLEAGERTHRASRKNFKKGKTRSSSSSSSDGSPEPKGKKAASRRSGEDHPAVVRLKRYIRACGAHRNYKKLLGSCRSHKERLNVLRAELEALGMKGNPSLEKCRALKEKREEAAEVASLDVANIISSTGRSRRRTAWNPSEAAPLGDRYHRTIDSEEEQPRQAPPDWSHMRGIISSDGESS